MNNETVLLNKNGFQFYKMKENEYYSTFSLKNNNILLSQIIDFNLIKLIYDLNTDIYELTHLEKVDEDNAFITIIMQHLFKDLGLPQRYSLLQMQRIVNTDEIIFIGNTTKDITNDTMIQFIPSNAELIQIQNIKNICKIITPHHIDFTFSVIFDKNMKIPLFAEKIISNIIYKIFIRVKQFIENIRV